MKETILSLTPMLIWIVGIIILSLFPYNPWPNAYPQYQYNPYENVNILLVPWVGYGGFIFTAISVFLIRYFEATQNKREKLKRETE